MTRSFLGVGLVLWVLTGCAGGADRAAGDADAGSAAAKSDGYEMNPVERWLAKQMWWAPPGIFH